MNSPDPELIATHSCTTFLHTPAPVKASANRISCAHNSLRTLEKLAQSPRAISPSQTQLTILSKQPAYTTNATAGDMSVSQDTLAPNGNELLSSMDQLKIEDNEARLGPDGEPAPKTDEEYAVAQLTLRAIVSSKEAGVIIGKGGKNVADLRDETGVKAGVSKVVQGVHDRVLTISGGCDAISRAYAIVARALLEGAPSMGMGGVIQSTGTHRESSLLPFRRTSLCCVMLTHLSTCKKSSCSSPIIRWVPSLADKV